MINLRERRLLRQLHVHIHGVRILLNVNNYDYEDSDGNYIDSINDDDMDVWKDGENVGDNDDYLSTEETNLDDGDKAT